jgi:hypothetical protein
LSFVFYALKARIMILLLGVCVTVTLTYLFSLVLFPLSFVFLRAERERNEGASHSPLIREGLEMKYGNTYGRFWRDHKGIMACMGWVLFFLFFFCFVDVLVLQDKHA